MDKETEARKEGETMKEWVGRVNSARKDRVLTVTDEMCRAYLQANTLYWQATDEAPPANPSKWRQGTPKEATRAGLIAALAARESQPAGEGLRSVIDAHIADLRRCLQILRGCTLNATADEVAKAADELEAALAAAPKAAAAPEGEPFTGMFCEPTDEERPAPEGEMPKFTAPLENIESPWNACMHKEHCVQWKAAATADAPPGWKRTPNGWEKTGEEDPEPAAMPEAEAFDECLREFEVEPRTGFAAICEQVWNRARTYSVPAQTGSELEEEAKAEGFDSMAEYVANLKTSASTYFAERNQARDLVRQYKAEGAALEAQERDAQRLAILATFAHEVYMGAYKRNEIEGKAGLALKRAELLEIASVAALSAGGRGGKS